MRVKYVPIQKDNEIMKLLFVLLCLALVACTAGPNSAANTPNAEYLVAGFWLGLWHGIIAVPTFIIGLFDSNVRVYEVHNIGNWYDLGFMLGIGAFAKGTHSSVKRVTK